MWITIPFSLRVPAFSFLTVILAVSCSQRPASVPDEAPRKSQDAARESFDRLNREKSRPGLPEYTGINEAPGVVDVEIIPEPDRAEMAEYRTGEPGWVEVEAVRSFSNSIAPDNARQELLQILRNQAISKKVPASIVVTSLLTDVMGETSGVANEQTAWSGFFKSTVSGVITAENIIRDTTIFESSGYKMELSLRAYVEPVQGQRDPGFYVDTKLNRNLLKDGDELAFTVKPSKSCYLYVFNLLVDHSVLLMFPNEYMQENFIAAGQSVSIPDPKIRNYIKFVVSALPGESLTTESVYIVCSKDPVPVADIPKIGKTMSTFSGQSQSFIKLQRWLIHIPLNQRVEKTLIYHVSE